MNGKGNEPKILIVDDEQEWLSQLDTAFHTHISCETVLLDSYDAADQFITTHDLAEYSAAVVDVRLRKPIYDQGGLAILNLLKERNRYMPTLVLTAYSYDYPGLHDVTQRYPSVFTYDKEVFQKQPQPIIDALLAKLPPQIGESGVSRWRPTRTSTLDAETQPYETKGAWREIVIGGLVIALILLAALLFLALSSRFTGFSWQLNIVFAVVMVALLSVILRIFRPQIVSQALSIYRELLRGHGGVHTQPHAVTAASKKKPKGS